MLIAKDKRYLRQSFTDEAEIERVVEANYRLIFGKLVVYLPKAKVSTIAGKSSIPDGFVIDLENESWYLVENELASHRTWEHIAPQVSKQLTALDNPVVKDALLQKVLQSAENDQVVKNIFAEAGIRPLHIHGTVAKILSNPVILAIPIDGIPPDLREWAATLKNEAKIWVISKYVSAIDSNDVIYGLPEDLTPTIATSPTEGVTISESTMQGTDLMLALIKAGLLSAGEELLMDYRPRGGRSHRFKAIVTERGTFIVEDTEYSSASYAAIACLKKAGSDRETENGLRKWRKKDGRSLVALRNELKKLETQ